MSTHRYILKTLSTVVVICFSFEIAQASLMSVPVQSSAKLNIQEVIRDPSKLQIPFEHCTVKEVYKGTSDKLIIHIQDAHANFSGQKNLAKTLDYLMTRYDIPTVLVEGSSIDATLSKVRGAMPKKDLEIAAKQLLYYSIISGEEYLNLTSEHDMKILGIENPYLYDQNILAYKKIIEHRDKALSLISKINKSLSKIKNQFYPRILLEYEDKKSNDSKLQFDELLKLADKSKISVSNDFKELPKLIELKEAESQINFDKANQEQSELLKAFTSKGLSNIATDYSRESKNKSSHISQFMFIDNLMKVAERNQIQTQKYLHLLQYRDYLKKFANLKLDQLLDEIKVFEQQVYDTLLQIDDSKKLRAIDRFIGLLKKAYRVQMNSDEFESYQVSKNDFPMESVIGFLNLKLAELNHFENFIPYGGDFSDNVIKRFYEVVDGRDSAFISNALNLLNNDELSTGFLVSGGYHTEHLTQLLRDEDISYVVLTPSVSSETDYLNYEQMLLLEQNSQSKHIERVGMVRLSDAITGSRLRFSHAVNAGARLSSVAEEVMREISNQDIRNSRYFEKRRNDANVTSARDGAPNSYNQNIGGARMTRDDALRVFVRGDGYYHVWDNQIQLMPDEVKSIADIFMDSKTLLHKASSEGEELDYIRTAIEYYISLRKWKDLPKDVLRESPYSELRCQNCFDWARTISVYLKFLEKKGYLKFYKNYGYATTRSLGNHVASAIAQSAAGGANKKSFKDVVVIDAWVTDYGEQIVIESFDSWKLHFGTYSLLFEPSAGIYYDSDEYAFSDESLYGRDRAALGNGKVNDLDRKYSSIYDRVAQLYYGDKYKVSSWTLGKDNGADANGSQGLNQSGVRMASTSAGISDGQLKSDFVYGEQMANNDLNIVSRLSSQPEQSLKDTQNSRLAVINDNIFLNTPLPFQQVLPNPFDEARITMIDTSSFIEHSTNPDGLVQFDGNTVIHPNGERVIIEADQGLIAKLQQSGQKSSADIFLERKSTWAKLRSFIKTISHEFRESLIIFFDISEFDERELVHAARLAKSIMSKGEFEGVIQFGVYGTERSELDAIALTKEILPMASYRRDGKNGARLSVVLASPQEVSKLPQSQSFLAVANELEKVADWPTQIYSAMIARWSYQTELNEKFVNLMTNLSNYPREHALKILRLFLAGDIQGRLVALNSMTPELAQKYPMNTLEAVKQLYLKMKLYEMTESAIEGAA